MKYLKEELWNDINGDEEWSIAYNNWKTYFKQISHKLPDDFVQELRLSGFHDFIVESQNLTRKYNKLKKAYEYDLDICLLPYVKNDNRKILLSFPNIKNFNMSFNFSGYNAEWLYCEILSHNKKTMSIEVVLYDGKIYCEFSELKYSVVV